MSGLKERLERLRASAAGRAVKSEEAGPETGLAGDVRESAMAGNAREAAFADSLREASSEAGWRQEGGMHARSGLSGLGGLDGHGGSEHRGIGGIGELEGQGGTGGHAAFDGIGQSGFSVGRVHSESDDIDGNSEPVGYGEGAGSGDQHLLHPEFRRLGVREMVNEAGAFLLRRAEYPLTYRHGRYRLGELSVCTPCLHPLASRQNGGKASARGGGKVRAEGTQASARVPTDPGIGDRDSVRPDGDRTRESREGPPPTAQSLLFLDTETTGLGVGAGNVPFMIGIGSWTEQGFVVEQGLIRHPGEERAMLTWLSGKFQGVTHLVTYNGRSFDWPVLESRFILNGWRRKGPAPGHLDFLHPSRALWRNTLPSCRLGTVEEQRLGIARGHDVPGALAPELYMRFLQDGDPSHLHGVFIHNELDVLTLSSIAVHFGHLLGGRLGSAVPVPVDAEERFRTGVWLERHGRADEARRLYDLLAEDAALETVHGRTDWQLSLAAKYKRMGHWARALPLWEQAAAEAEAARLPRLDAHLELAMYYEHRAKDYEAALNHASKALTLFQRRRSAMRSSSAASSEEKARLERRVDRLRRKLERGSGGADDRLAFWSGGFAE